MIPTLRLAGVIETHARVPSFFLVVVIIFALKARQIINEEVLCVDGGFLSDAAVCDARRCASFVCLG